jgi:hypothetical protein
METKQISEKLHEEIRVLVQHYQDRESILARIFKRAEIDKDTGCWEWTGGHSGNGRGGGYARVSIRGKTYAGHRAVWEILFGPCGDKQLDHICNNRKCINPYHMELVTNKENCKRRSERLKRKGKV